MPGLGRGGLDPRKMKKMMKQFGINIEEIDDVKEVIIKTKSKDYVFNTPSVTIMTTQGEKTFQITGKPEILERAAGETLGELASTTEPVEPTIPTDDVKLVMDQTGVSEEEARQALEECNGNPAEAIIKLMENS